MRVVFVIPYFYPAFRYGGQPRSAYELARGLADLGHDVRVLTTDSLGDRRLSDESRPPEQGIRVEYYRNLSNHLAYNWRIFIPIRFFLEIRREIAKADIVHIHELRTFLTVAAARAARSLRIPYVLSPHGGLRHLGRVQSKRVYDALWGRDIVRQAGAVLAVSPIETADALDFQVRPERVHVVPNSVRSDDYQAAPQRGLFRSRWKIGDGPIVLFLGRLHWIKGADLLIEACRILNERGIFLYVVFAGPDDGQEGDLRRLAAGYNLGRNVIFTGFLDHGQKLEALMDASVVVIPSRSEVFAITALEALLCSRPVLMSEACGLSPSPGRGGGVFEFKRDDPASLGEELANLLSFNSNESAKKGRDFVISEFSVREVARKVEAIYSELLLTRTAEETS